MSDLWKREHPRCMEGALSRLQRLLQRIEALLRARNMILRYILGYYYYWTFSGLGITPSIPFIYTRCPLYCRNFLHRIFYTHWCTLSKHGQISYSIL
jgi:hypothetical protein